MKKILFVSSCYPSVDTPQYCIFLEQQAKALKNIGNIVDVLVPTACNSYNYQQDNVIFFNNLKIYNVFFEESKIRERLLLHDSKLIRKIEKIISQNKYDFISIHLCNDFIRTNIVRISRKYNIKVIVHFHGLNVWKDYYCAHPIYNKYLVWHRKLVLRKTDAIIGVSNKVCNIVREELSHKNIYTVYNGVDTTIFKPLENKDNPVFNIACIANLIPIKGHYYLLEAVCRLIERNKDKRIRLIIVGKGSEEQKLKEQVRNLNIHNYVNFLGYIEYSKIPQILSRASVFVMPSYYEALGCVYLEAMACKVPVIGCENMGINEIIKNEENGLLVKELDSEDIFNKLHYLLNQPEVRNQIAENGYKTVLNHYTWDNSAEMLDKIYRMIL